MEGFRNLSGSAKFLVICFFASILSIVGIAFFWMVVSIGAMVRGDAKTAAACQPLGYEIVIVFLLFRYLIYRENKKKV